MAAECVLWAVILVGIARVQQNLWPVRPAFLQWDVLRCLVDAGAGWQTVLARLIGYCGAGLYEEVLFRLLMLPIAVWAFERLGCSSVTAGLWAILLSSLLFSAAHYIGPLGDSFDIYSFTFPRRGRVVFRDLVPAARLWHHCRHAFFLRRSRRAGIVH